MHDVITIALADFRRHVSHRLGLPVKKSNHEGIFYSPRAWTASYDGFGRSGAPRDSANRRLTAGLPVNRGFLRRDAMSVVFILIAVLCLAFANGGNDNFKGVATLFGSGTTNYRGALAWATITTLLGSLTAVFLANRLLANFSGRGLVADGLVTDVDFVAAVGLAAGLTVLLATRVGMPISTTHSLLGALVGAGWAAGSAINLGETRRRFFPADVGQPPAGGQRDRRVI